MPTHSLRRIPPRSLVRLIRVDAAVPAWRRDVGKVYRVGYSACEFDTEETVWLVDEHGEYVDCADLGMIAKYFRVERWSRERDFEGVNRPPLRANPGQQAASVDFPPPGTILKLRCACAALNRIPEEAGNLFQVDWYDACLGLETVWIAGAKGGAVGTLPRNRLRRYFNIVRLAETADYTGLAKMPRPTGKSTRELK